MSEMHRNLSVACDLPTEKEVYKMSSLESLSLATLLKSGTLSGKRPSPLPFLPPQLAKNAQMVLVESSG